VVAPGLIGLNSIISIPTLEEWTLAGIGGWKMGDGGQSCDKVCNNSGLACFALNSGQQPSRSVSFALFKYFGIISYVGQVYPTPMSNEAMPACTRDRGEDNWCDYGSGNSVCNKVLLLTSRLCACRSSSLTYQGASACQDCVAGKYLGTGGNDAATDCVLCDTGKYSALVGASTCLACAAGTYSATAGASSASTCLACAAGTYSASSGASVCLACAAGTYAASGAASACLACAAGTYSPTAGVIRDPYLGR
jgi:hypothetical protein